jgi:N-acetylmuramoyl-L-alanine amidase
MVKLHWLLPTSSLLALLMMSSPADAAKLQSWRFDTNTNQLEFTTDDAVQPKALLLYNPTRLVLDLPGINFDEATVTRQLGGAVRSIRVGQLDNRTTRLVVELKPGYTLDPQQVRVRGISPRKWAVQLPTPQLSPSVSRSGGESDPITSDAPDSESLATIQSVKLQGRKLIIRGNQRFTYSSGWDRSNGLFRITINGATLARAVSGPNLSAQSPVQRVRLQQPDSQTVVIYIQPDARVQIGGINQLSSQMVALELHPLAVPSAPIGTIPLPVEGTQPSPPMSRIGQKRVLVMLDPGHGGKDSGAVGIRGLEEKNVILPISLKVASILRENGVDVELTRNSDYFVDLAPRVEMAKRDHVDLFVSIHANSVDYKPSVNGLETYYFESGLRLAQTVHKAILGDINVRDRGVRHARFYVLRKNPMPAILIETGYVTGVEDSSRLATPEYQDQMAQAIARGILEYIRENF